MNLQLKKIFTVNSLIAPIIIMYSVGDIPILLLSVLGWCIVCLIFKLHQLRVRLSVELLVIAGMAFANYMLMLLLPGLANSKPIFTSEISFIFYLLITALFAKDYFEPVFGYRLYKIICILATAFIIIQQILYQFFGYILSGYIDLFQTEYLDANLKNYAMLQFRPTSFFSEPAGYATYVAIFLLIYLFQDKKNYKLTFYFIVGILLSLSSTGLLLIVVDFAMYFSFGYHFKINRKKMWKVCITVIAFLAVMYISYEKGILDTLVNHIIGYEKGRFVLASGTTQRIGYIKPAFDANMTSLVNWALGNGISDFGEEFLPGIIKLVLSFGILGTLIYFGALLSIFQKSIKIQKILIVVMIIASATSNSLMGIQPFIYFPLIFNITNNLESDYLIKKEGKL